jgi:hypothetical protein
MGMCKSCKLVFNTNDMTGGYCSNCLEIFKNDIVFCNKCKTINKSTSKFCKECGNKFEIIIHEQNIKLNEKQQFTQEETEKNFSVQKKENLDVFKEKLSKNNSNVDELLKWANLLEKGLISQEEFNIKKEELF